MTTCPLGPTLCVIHGSLTQAASQCAVSPAIANGCEFDGWSQTRLTSRTATGNNMDRKSMAAVATALLLLAGCGDTSDPELTRQFIEEFTACLTDEGINVDRVDASVTEDRELQMRGWAASGSSARTAEGSRPSRPSPVEAAAPSRNLVLGCWQQELVLSHEAVAIRPSEPHKNRSRTFLQGPM